MEVTWYPAPAKLNLFLHVLGRRPDGYHELQTVFRLIDRSDRVGVAPRKDGKIRFDGPFGDNLACCANWWAGLRTPEEQPVGGGLGGGLDAANTLLA
jgi:4-diphosphocytidyl-2-C-methyl-D-erythritol kinase